MRASRDAPHDSPFSDQHELRADKFVLVLFFFNDTATTEIYTLSLHDALPISTRPARNSSARPATSSTSASTLPRWWCAESDRKSTRLNSSHVRISYAVFCLKTKIHGVLVPLAHRLRRYETTHLELAPQVG